MLHYVALLQAEGAVGGGREAEGGRRGGGGWERRRPRGRATPGLSAHHPRSLRHLLGPIKTLAEQRHPQEEEMRLEMLLWKWCLYLRLPNGRDLKKISIYKNVFFLLSFYLWVGGVNIIRSRSHTDWRTRSFDSGVKSNRFESTGCKDESRQKYYHITINNKKKKSHKKTWWK